MPDTARRCTLALALLLSMGTTGAQPPSVLRVDVAEELERLAGEYGFDIVGEEHLAEAEGRAQGRDAMERLRALLEEFDHIIVQGSGGDIERVIVLGVTLPGAVPEANEPLVAIDGEAPPDAPIELPTIRRGSQHSVRVALEGEGGKRLARVLLIDTGADTLVLPSSLIDNLGVDASSLQAREVQTANGRTEARIGRLAAVWLGSRRITDVEVSFLDDDKLGGSGLLGMSVLGRYQMTIDDQDNRLILTAR